MAKIFQIHQVDSGFSFNSVSYNFSDVDVVNYTYNQKNRLTRGANAQNSVGISYKEGLKTPDIAETKIKDCSIEVYNLLLSLWKSEGRINFWIVDRKTGEGYTYKNAIIRDKPRQTEVSETEDSISFMLAVESFDVSEKLSDE
jgi:hypothetical protein